VVFSSTATVEIPKLINATSENKKKIIAIIDNIKTSAGSNYEDAFKKAYELVRASRADDLGPTSCQNMFLFMTDGRPRVGLTYINELVAMIGLIEKKEKIDAIIMTYSFGTDSDPAELLPISCARGGITEQVRNNLELKEKLQNYYLLLSRGMTRSEIIWTDAYDDIIGSLKKTTAVLPFYERSATPPILLGVIGMDFIVTELEKKYTNSDVLLKSMISTGCTKINLSQCQLDALRPQEFRCAVKNCLPFEIERGDVSVCSKDYKISNAFKSWGPINDNLTLNNCCGENTCDVNNKGLFIGLPVGVVCLFGLLSLICCCFCWIKKWCCWKRNNILTKIHQSQTVKI